LGWPLVLTEGMRNAYEILLQRCHLKGRFENSISGEKTPFFSRCMVPTLSVSYVFLLLLFLSWGETESAWYCGHCLAYCTSPQMMMMVVE
jgi:hypothetical protein